MNLSDYTLIAHRGLYSNENKIPENSLSAFSDAISNKVAIELDVHITRDGYLVVCHDYNLKRLTSQDIIIEKSNYSELKNLKLLNTLNTIPTLDEVLTLVSGKVSLLIELKNEGFAGKLEKKLLETLKNYNGQFIITSFNPFSLIWFKKHAPQITRAQLITTDKTFSLFIIQFILNHILLNFIVKPDIISYNITSLNEKIVNKYKNKNIKVFTWTISDTFSLKKAKKIEVDAIIFDTISLREASNFNNKER